MSYRIVEEMFQLFEALAGMPDDVTAAERITLIVLAHHANERTRECWPGSKVLHTRTGMHEDTVRKAITSLENRGLVERVGLAGGHGRRQAYRITSPAVRSGQPKATSPDVRSGHSAQEPGRGNGIARILEPVSPDARSDPLSQEPVRTVSDSTIELLAVFTKSHPGREQQALRAARHWYHETYGRELSRRKELAYFSKWSVDDLKSKLYVPLAPRTWWG